MSDGDDVADLGREVTGDEPPRPVVPSGEPNAAGGFLALLLHPLLRHLLGRR